MALIGPPVEEQPLKPVLPVKPGDVASEIKEVTARLQKRLEALQTDQPQPQLPQTPKDAVSSIMAQYGLQAQEQSYYAGLSRGAPNVQVAPVPPRVETAQELKARQLAASAPEQLRAKIVEQNAPLSSLPVDQEYLVRQARLRQEQADLTDRLQKLYARRDIASLLPMLMQAGKVQTEQDAQTYFAPLTSEQDYVAQVYRSEQERQALTAKDPVTVERRKELVSQLSRTAAVNVYGIAHATGESLLGLTTKAIQPQLAPGTTVEDVLAALKEAGIPGEQSKALIDSMQQPITDAIQNWKERDAALAQLRSSFASASIDELKLQIQKAGLRNMLSQPSLALMLPWEWYQEHISRPTSGLFQLGIRRVPQPEELAARLSGDEKLIYQVRTQQDTQFVDLFNAAKQNQNWYSAAGYAWENWKGNAVYKLAVEATLDPLNVVGWGWWTKAARVWPVLKPLAGAEEAYLATIDLGFGTWQAAWRAVPKLPSQMAVEKAAATLNAVKQLSEKVFQAPLRTLETGKITMMLKDVVRAFELNPTKNQMEGNVARLLVEHPALTRQEVESLAAKVGLTVGKTSADRRAFNMLARDLEEQLHGSAKLFGTLYHTDSEATLALAQVLGVDHNQYQDVLSQFLTSRRQLIDKRVVSTLGATTTRDLLVRLADHTGGIELANLANPAVEGRGVIASLTSGLSSVPVASHAVWTLGALNRLQYNFARNYLLFFFYGYGNILETGVKTAIAGINPFDLKDAPEKFLDHTQGLTGIPMHMLTDPKFQAGIAPIEDSIRVVEARAGGRLNNLYAAEATSHQNWLKWFTGSMNQLFIKNPSEFGGRQMARFIDSMYQKELWARQGKVLSEVTDLIEVNAFILRGMEPELIDAVKKEIFWTAVSNPRKMIEFGKFFEPAAIKLQQVQKLASHYPTIGPEIQSIFQHYGKQGVLWSKVSDGSLFKEVEQLIWNEQLVIPGLIGQRLGELTHALTSASATGDSMLYEMSASSHIMQLYHEVMSSQFSGYQAMARNFPLSAGRLESYRRKLTAIWEPLMRDFEDTFTQLSQHIKAQGHLVQSPYDAPAVPKLEAKLNRLVKVSQQFRKDVTDLVETQLSDPEFGRAATTRKIHSSGQKAGIGHPVMEEFYANVWASVEARWQQFADDTAKLAAERVHGIPRHIGSAPTRDPSVPLTLLEAAKLFGSVPEGLHASLYVPELLSLQSKSSWTEQILQQVRVITGITNTDVRGYPKEAVEALYDQLLQRGGLKTNLYGAWAPRFREWEALHSELLHLGQSKGQLLDSEVRSKLDQFGASLFDNIQYHSEASAVMPLQDTVGSTFNELAAKTGMDTDSLLKPVGRRALASQLFAWQRSSSNETLQEAARLAVEDIEYQRELQQQLAKAFPSGYIPVFRSRAGRPLDREFTNVSTALRTAESFTPEGAKPEIVQWWIPARDVVAASSNAEMLESELLVKSAALREARTRDPAIMTNWLKARQEAFDAAMQKVNLTFPDYEHGTAFNAAMKAILPFWTYEAHRWFYTPRLFLQHPGVWSALGKYQDHTDLGYIHIPGTSIDVNFLRGTLLAGGFRSLLQQSFPTFFDQWPGLANAVDQVQRWGFYPNIYVTGLFSALGSKTGEPQFGELVPAVYRDLLTEPVQAIAPGSQAAKLLRNILLPDRFRAYMTALEASRIGKEKGISGLAILDKLRAHEPLTPDEEQLWNSAWRGSSAWVYLLDQGGMFRIRPQELVQSKELALQIIADYTRVPVAVQKEAIRNGYRLEDFIPFPPELNDYLYGIAELAQWRGLSSHLQESAVGQAIGTARRFWQLVDDKRQQLQQRKQSLDIQWQTGTVNHADWKSQREDLNGALTTYIENLQSDPRFKDVPVGFQERVKWANDHKTLPSIMHPEEELLAQYMQLQPESFRFYDPEVGGTVIDWAGYFTWRKLIENSLLPSQAASFTARLSRYDTPLDAWRRQDYNQFLQPYLALKDHLLSLRTPEEQAIIRQYMFTDDPEKRKALQAKLDVLGQKVVADYTGDLSKARKQLRALSPELDARLMFWRESGIISPGSEQGLELYKQLRKERGFQKQQLDFNPDTR